METAATVVEDGVYCNCRKCGGYTQCDVSEGINVVYIFCKKCTQFIGTLNKQSKKLYYWHTYNQGDVAAEEESPYP